MTKKIAIATNKGGVLKTTIATNVASMYAQKNKTLIIDMDGQANTTLSFGINPDNLENTAYDILVEGMDPQDVVLKITDTLDLIPANGDLDFFDLDVLTDQKKFPQPFQLLKQKFEKFVEQYDYVIIDCPPALSLVNGNVLSFVDSVIIPFQPETFSQRSLVKMLQSVESFKKQNHDLKIEGVIATLVDSRTNLHREITESCQDYCDKNGVYFFKTIIPRSIEHSNAIGYEKKPLMMILKRKSKMELKSPYLKLFKELCNKEMSGSGKK